MSETPAYSVIGGVYDILEATDGETYAVEEDDAIKAGEILEEIEEIDVLTPAKVALASLIQAKEKEKSTKMTAYYSTLAVVE